MGIMQGSFSGRVYRVRAPEGEKMPTFESRMLEVQRRSFVPVKAGDGEDESWGWTNPRSPMDRLDDPTGLPRDSEFILLALRHDKIRIDPLRLRSELERRTRDSLLGTGLLSPTKEMKARLMAEARLELLTTTPPRTRLYEALWDTAAGVLFIATTSLRANYILTDLFAETFGVELRQLGPGAMAQELADAEPDSQKAHDVLGRLQPTVFTTPETAFKLAENAEGSSASIVRARLAFLGPEMLTWLWSRQSELSGTVIGGPIALGSPTGCSRLQILSGEAPEDSPEATTGLGEGKKLAKCRLCLAGGESEPGLDAVVDATFTLSGLKIVSYDKDDPEGSFFTRSRELCGSFDMLMRTFGEFAGERLNSRRWPSRVKKIAAWIEGRS
jgi:hypothetical protein